MKSRLGFRTKQAGMLLPVAVFLLVVLAALSGYAMRMAVMASVSIGQEVSSVQAYMVAKAANEWVAYQLYQPDASGAPAAQSCPTTTALTINGFSVQISCAMQQYVDKGDQDVRVYQVTLVASRGTVATTDYIERQVSSTWSRCIEADDTGVKVECN